MEPDFREEIRGRYIRPYKRNMTVLISCLILAYIVITGGQLLAGQPENKINFAPLIVVTIGFIFAFWLAYPKFKKMNIHYKHDAEYGMIVKEQTSVIKVFDTPAGINIYWLDCDAIKTFTPDPYRAFREGDVVTIYYLKFSKEYLAYDL
ncbi:hypothetical protein [Taibaiella lutea]|nr:hypothetical protein [Taibaiella lutea]